MSNNNNNNNNIGDNKKLINLIEEENEKIEESDVLSKTTKLNIPSTSKSTLLEVNDMDKYKSFLLNKPDTKMLKPSEALNKVRQFLPMLKESTDKLLQEFKDKPDELNIENVGDEDEHIEMNVAFVPEDSSDEDDSDEEFDQDESDSTENENDQLDQDDYKRKHSDSNSPEPLDDLGLGFKYSTKMKIKLNRDKKLKKNLIQEVEDNRNSNETKNVENQ